MTCRRRIDAPGPEAAARSTGWHPGSSASRSRAKLERDLRSATGVTTSSWPTCSTTSGARAPAPSSPRASPWGSTPTTSRSTGGGGGYSTGPACSTACATSTTTMRWRPSSRRTRRRHDLRQRALADHLYSWCSRNATADSPVAAQQQPAAMFNDRCRLQPRPACGSSLRASTAADLHFPRDRAPRRQRFVFVDSAITPFNNPALQLFVMAMRAAYRLGWPTGIRRPAARLGRHRQRRHSGPASMPTTCTSCTRSTSAMKRFSVRRRRSRDVLCQLLGTAGSAPESTPEIGDLHVAWNALLLTRYHTRPL